jgi:predicted RNA-binding Zn-ribbon protein involved in translation (DUF1610 family)
MNKKPYYLCFCESCRLDFLVKQIKKSRFFCPGCGENMDVSILKKTWIERPYGYRTLWTKEEDLKIVNLLKSGLDYQGIADQLTGRTYDSVRRRISRLREQGCR